MGKRCQSCGMPMKTADMQGTESNGSLSETYCTYCYQNGVFTQPDFTAKAMQDFCIVKMKEMGFPKPIAWLFTRGIPKLKRWKVRSA